MLKWTFQQHYTEDHPFWMTAIQRHTSQPPMLVIALLFANQQQFKFCAKKVTCKVSMSHLCCYRYVWSSSSLLSTILYQRLMHVSFVYLMVVLHLILTEHSKPNTMNTLCMHQAAATYSPLQYWRLSPLLCCNQWKGNSCLAHWLFGISSLFYNVVPIYVTFWMNVK